MSNLDKATFMDKMRKNIAPNVGISTEDTHTLSMVSYTTHMAGELYEQAILDGYVLQREMFPITASVPENMYKFSAANGVSDVTAVPAYSTIYLILKESELLENAEYQNGKYVYIMDDFSILVDDEYTFSADYPIEISLFENAQGEYSCTARYISDGSNPVSTLNNAFLKAMKQGSDGFIIELFVRQYDVKSESQTFLNTNNIETSTFRVTFDDQLADFRVTYKETEDADSVTLNKAMTFDYTAGYDTVFYKYISSNEIAILFKKSAFYPEVNSEITVDIYSTKGAEGTFQYNGQAVEHDYTPRYGEKINMNISMTDSRLGEDAPSLEELREATIDAIKRRNSIVTTADLESHYTNNANVDYTMIKRKHTNVFMDYEIFGKLKMPGGLVIPTNTVDVKIADAKWDYIDEQEVHMLHDFSLIKLDGVSGQYKAEAIDRIENYGRVDESDKSIFYYTTPFLMSFHKTRNIISLYEAEINKQYPVELKQSNTTASMSYIVNNVNLIRKTGETKYRFKFNLLTNLSESTELIHSTAEDGSIVDNDYIRVFVALGNSFKGYVKATLTGYTEGTDYYTYEAEMELPNLHISEDDEVEMQFLKAGETITDYVPISDQLISVYVYSKEAVTSQFSETNISITDDFKLIDKYGAEITLFENFTEDTSLTVVPNIGYVDVLRVPVIRYNMYRVEEYREVIAEIISFELEKLRTLYMQTEQNYDLHFWLYNTYGIPSNLGLGTGTNLIDLNRTNLSLDFNVKLNYGASVTTSAITEFIKSAVEDIKYVDGETFHISQLITDIKKEYVDIAEIEFLGINGNTIEKQKITATVDKIDFDIPEDVCISTNIDEHNLITLDISINYL